MSNTHNTNWIEAIKEDFGTALFNENAEDALKIIEKLESHGFSKEASDLDELLVRADLCRDCNGEKTITHTEFDNVTESPCHCTR